MNYIPFRYTTLITFLIIASCGKAQEPSNDNPALLTELVDLVSENHLAPTAINDELSKAIFHSFFQKIDPQKKIITLQELQQLKAQETTLDDAFQNGSSHFFNTTSVVYKNGIVRAERYVNEFLSNKIEITTEEALEVNSEKIDFAKGEKELKIRWRLIVKQKFIATLYLTEIALQNLTFQEQKDLALKKTKAFFINYFYKKNSQTREELLELYINSFISNNDYQSAFLFPKSKADWDAKFDRSFVGVGLSIVTTTTYPQISNVLFDDPAWKTKKIKVGNILMKISNEENEFINVINSPLTKIIDLLKGKAGSVVRIVIKDSNDSIQEVAIKRGPVSMPLAMSFVLKKEQDKKKIGYIHLPRFYVGKETCASHILKELERLKEQQVDGIIFDVRNNHGGSSREALKIMGYFLNGGVLMQVKYANGNHRKLEAPDNLSKYQGALIVLVNNRSSSASELLAGTLQDYERAIVVGNQTFGKGTIQRFFDVIDEKETTPLGSIKLSIGSFYTGLGRSTQYNGIRPDIILPNTNKYIPTGERSIKNALKFEDLASIERISPTHQTSLDSLLKRSRARQLNNSYFLEIEQKALSNKDKPSLVSLNYKRYKLAQDKQKISTSNKPPIEDFVVLNSSDAVYEQQRTAHLKSTLESDQAVYESFLIMNDYLDLSKDS